MRVTKFDWNVAVVGAWNPAILTPSGIARRAFQVEPPTPLDIEIEVAWEQMQPPRLIRDDLVASADARRLLIALQQFDYATLDRARVAARHVVASLPETPLRAVGLNVRHRIEDPSADFLRLIQSPLDAALSRSGKDIVRRQEARRVSFTQGVINVMADQSEEDVWAVNLNFHLDTNSANQVQEWLGIPIGDIESSATSLLRDVFGLTEIQEGD